MLAKTTRSSTASQRVVALAARGRSVLPRKLLAPCTQLRAYEPACVLHGGSSLSARLVSFQRGLRLLCWSGANPVDANSSDDEEPMPPWVQKLSTAIKEATAASLQEALETQRILGVLLEATVRNLYPRLGIRGADAVLQSVDDVLEFLLPPRILLTVVQDHEFFRAVRTAIIASLLDKDTGFLKAIIALLKAEGMEQEAGQVEAVLHSGTGIEAASEGLHTVQQCLKVVEECAKAKGLDDEDVRQLSKYANATSMQKRVELLETTLFVRCTAAMLHGSYTSMLEVDAGAGIGCELDKGAGALRLRVGKTKYSRDEVDAVIKQLQVLFLVAAFTLDKVLAAAVAAPAAQAELKQLPCCFIMDGFCLYTGGEIIQQKAAADRRTVADTSVIGRGGLQSAVLQVHFQSARDVPR